MKKGSTTISVCVTATLIFVLHYPWMIYKDSVRIPNFMDKVPEMEKIFDEQINELRARGFGGEFLGDLMVQRTSVTVKAAKMDIGEGNIPFIPAITVSYGLSGKCGKPKFKHNDKKLQIKNKKQFLGLGELYSSDVRMTPYYLFDVSSGQDMCGSSPREASAKLASLGRRPLNVIEGAFLLALGGGITKNGMWFAGSRCHGRVPVAYLSGDEVFIDSESPDVRYKDRGVVSCIID